MYQAEDKMYKNVKELYLQIFYYDSHCFFRCSLTILEWWISI